MATINVSLPDKLKDQAQELVNMGVYVSFSDLVRDSLRETLRKNKYDLWTIEAQDELKKGKGKMLRTPKEVDAYFETL